MSNDGMMLLTVSGATPEEFFERFGEVALRFGYRPPEVMSESSSRLQQARAAERELPEAVTIGDLGARMGMEPFRQELPSTGRLNPKKRRRRTVAQIEADRAAALTDSPAPPPLTIADVKLAGGRLLQANNGDPAPLRELLATYGVVRMTPLPEEHWAEFISKCDQGGAA